MDLIRLKGAYDLAQMNHNSFQNEETAAALEKAKSDYEAALSVEQVPEVLTVMIDEGVDYNETIAVLEAQLKAAKAAQKATKQPVVPSTKASTAKAGEVGSGNVAGNITVVGDPAHSDKAVVVAPEPVSTGETGGASDATKTAAALANAEKKSE